MKVLLKVILFVIGFGVLSNGNAQTLNATYRNEPLQNIINDLQNQTGFRFFYQDGLLDEFKITAEIDEADITKAMETILLKIPLHFTIVRKDQVYITKEKLEPVIFIVENDIHKMDKHAQKDDSPTLSEQRYLVGRKADVVETMIVGDKKNQGAARFVTLRLNLKDQEKGEPLFSAAMFIEETQEGAVSDVNGNMVVALEPGLSYTASFSSLGMKKRTIQIIPYESGNLNIELIPEVVAIKEITIKADQQQKLYGVNVGMEKLSMKNIKELPSLMGEKDIVKISQFLPGVQTVGEGSSGVYIRGGNADQNLFYINGVPVYNTSHLFGFFSAFNSTLVSDFTMYKGHIPSNYGGRLSSFFDISTRLGNTRKFSAKGGISPVSADLISEIPIIKEKASLVVSARSSYSDWILNQLEDPDLRNSKAGFYDLASSLNYKIDENNFVKGFGYYSQDNFTLSDLQEYSYQNMGGSMQWVHYFSPALSMDAAAVVSKYQFYTRDFSHEATAYSHSYTIRHNEAKVDFTWKVNPKHELNFGANAISYGLNRGKVVPDGENSLRIPIDLGQEQGIESAIYLSNLYTPVTWLTAYAGLRYSLYSYIGPATINQYLPGSEQIPENVTGTIDYDKGEMITTSTYPEVRLSVNIRPWSLTSFKMAYNTSTQNVFMLSNTVAIAPNDQWKLSDPYIKPARGNQFSVGILQEIPSMGLSLSAEVYQKGASNIVEYKDGADFISTPNVETLVLQGNQQAYGVEFMVKKNTGNLTGWIAYTYSRSKVTVAGENDWENINNGNPYPANYDIPHSANVIANYKFNRRLSLSANGVYKTGRPMTYPQSIYYIDEKQIIDYSGRNAYRIPDYFRLDASLTLEGNLKKNKLIHSSWMLSVYNLTGRNNPYSVFFNMENGIVKGYQYSVIGVPIVTLKWIFKLGNYAAE